MGRHSSFNRQQVLSEALSLFWSRGFAAASVKQLETATDMHPGSLYYHFKNKEQLYLTVLDYYLEWCLQPRIDKHLIYGAAFSGLRRFFTSGYRHRQEQAYQNCCFLVSTSTELHLLPEEAASLVKQGIQRLHNGFINHLGRTVPGESPEPMASELINLYLSTQLQAKIDPNQQRLDKRVSSSLHHLFPPPDKKS